MSTESDRENEIKIWLDKVLVNEKLKKISLETIGNSEKGDGYIGDIVFVTVKGTTENNAIKDYHLVLKCSKRSLALRENFPVKDTFLNEAYFYETVYPYFCKFQLEQGTPDPFISVAKCYGTFIEENTEVMVLENLKLKGYELWPRKEPLSRKHIDLVVSEYGKFHATSLAIMIKQPDKFKEITKIFNGIYQKMIATTDMEKLYSKPINESYELLKNELDEKTLNTWMDLKKQINFIFTDMKENNPGLNVILHGDCWNNNFMFLHSGEDKHPIKVAFLDWQICHYASPILDLSYFLFSCLSEDELKNFDDILLLYHNSFLQHLKFLGIEHPQDIYPFSQFMKEWKSYSRYGVLMTSFLMKIVSTDSDEVLDIGQVVDGGEDFTAVFQHEIRDKENFKKRIKPIVQYAVNNQII